MSTKLLIIILAISTGGNPTLTKSTPPALLPDGLILKGLEGKLSGPDGNDGWFFEPDSDITDNQAVIKAGIKLKLLPSGTLEKIIADANERSVKRYRLNVRVTKYKGRNFLFPFYFLPISAPTPVLRQEDVGVKQQPRTSKQTTPETTTPVTQSGHDPNLNDANDILSIPPEVMEKIEAAKKKMAVSGQRISDSNRVSIGQSKPAIGEPNLPITDSVLIDRTALIIERQNGEFIFTLDAFGRNVPQVSLRPLPCEVLELAELIQSAVPDPVRFKITGIVTKYKGNDYLLPQKATRIYGQGNFGI